LLAFAAVVVIGMVAGGPAARAVPGDPAARGLDAFLYLPTAAAPGGRLELVAQAFGFPTVTQAVPLPGATFEVGWDPESVFGSTIPDPVTVKADAEGRVRLSLPVPPGKTDKLELLVAVRHGSHERTRTVAIGRGLRAQIEVHTADVRVVPRSTVSAWVRMTGTSGEPLPDSNVTVSLLEGRTVRHRQTLRTDAGGMVMARVPIPRIDEPQWTWTLRAEAAPAAESSGPDLRTGTAEITLHAREENPGTPTLETEWRAPPGGAKPGDKLEFRVRVRDAVGHALAGQRVRWWVGVKGATPPKTDEEWEKQSTSGTTDASGEVAGARDAPTLVKPGGSGLVLHARVVVDGHPLDSSRSVAVGSSSASVTLKPEVYRLVPGLSHKLLLTVLDGHGGGVAGELAVTADGLSTVVKTNAEGEGELTWQVPRGVGAGREVGPCAGGVAAAVTVKPVRPLPALAGHPEPFSLCLAVDREVPGIVRVTPDVARPGEKVTVTVARSPGVPGEAGDPGRPAGNRSAVSVLLRAMHHDQAVAAWLEPRPDGTASAELTVPENAAEGLWNVSAALPETGRASRTLNRSLLVVPRVMPSLEAKRAGGRPTPGGEIEIDAHLTDGAGKGLRGAVSAIVVDAFGGGAVNVAHLDTRLRLCRAMSVPEPYCRKVLERDPSTEPLRRSLLADYQQSRGVEPSNDPGANATAALEKAFASVLLSLEGAVTQSTQTPQALIDTRRKENGRWVFNPELFTLVTDAMQEPPTTPGGEKLVLSDLFAVDPQVTFDNVARRVTRLKLFMVLAAVRTWRASVKADADEPVFRDPNALLRRLVRDTALPAETLLDPWGGTIQFVRGNGNLNVPFLGVVRGFELHAPGPDGQIGTADDVRDPFERVVRSGSPYARAVKEDSIVDAKWDMIVGDDTMRNWQEVFERATGRELGIGAGGMGLTGVGEGGGGRGEGIGLGGLGTIGHGRGSSGIATGDAFWTAPVRTSDDGRVRLRVPLGSAETTWKIALVGVPDGHGPASTVVEVASDLPLSMRVDAGARWVSGDALDANVYLRNRTAAPLRVSITAAAEGAAALASPAGAAQTIDVPARGGSSVPVRLRSTRAGEGRLVLSARAPGVAEDVLRHTWEIAPAGEQRSLTQTSWIASKRELRIGLDHGYTLAGHPRLVLERGYDDAVAAALGATEPESQTSLQSLLDAREIANRVNAWATTKERPRHKALAAIADTIAGRALGRFHMLSERDKASGLEGPVNDLTATQWLLRSRAASLPKDEKRKKKSDDGAELCPYEPRGGSWSTAGPGAGAADVLDLEPAASAQPLACWNAFVSGVARTIVSPGDPEQLAIAVLALAERPHRNAIAANLADRLRTVVQLDASGEIAATAGLGERSRRATIYAALLRAQRLGTSKASAEALFARLAPLRDVSGGYGSSTATLAVVRALLSSQLDATGKTHVVVRTTDGKRFERELDLPSSDFASVDLPDDTLGVQVEVRGPGVVARFERPVLRSWSRPPPPRASPLDLQITWPDDARVGGSGMLRVRLRHEGASKLEADTRVPLPPGVTLASATPGIAQLQGTLLIRRTVESGNETLVEVPVRFGLAGTLTVPEATAHVAYSDVAPSTAPSRRLVVR